MSIPTLLQSDSRNDDVEDVKTPSTSPLWPMALSLGTYRSGLNQRQTSLDHLTHTELCCFSMLFVAFLRFANDFLRELKSSFLIMELTILG